MNKIDKRFLNWTFDSALVLVAAVLAGRWLTVKFGVSANVVLLLLLLAFLLAGYNLYKLVKDATKEK